uniref:Peptidase_M16_C domain-containing protein n=1 Tax=Nippostrongylus brasiliensis TaxID=27835 RepID=A0A0N4XKB9_NIPBR
LNQYNYNQIDSSEKDEWETDKRTTTPKPTTQPEKILSSEKIIKLVNKYRADVVKEGTPQAEVMFEVKNDDSLKDYAMSLAYCKRARIPKRYSYFSFGSRKTGAAMVEQALSHYVNQLGQPHNNLKPQAFRKAASLIYYKSTRAYCFMQLQSCMVRANVWKNMLACVFNNRYDSLLKF